MSPTGAEAATTEASSSKASHQENHANTPTPEQRTRPSSPIEQEQPESLDQASTSTPSRKGKEPEDTSAPPLPDEEPPLPDETPPAQEPEDDGWAPVWDATAGAFYFYNRFTQATQWENPRVPEASAVPTLAPGVPAPTPLPQELPPSRPAAGGYDPAIHGDYDETAWYAQPAQPEPAPDAGAVDAAAAYVATGAFNRFTGRWQAAELTPENFNDENKSRRQMNAFFDVDAAANSHDGKSLKAERSAKKLSRSEVKQFKEKRKARKEEKRRAWLLD